ncbi:MAG: hypothetical protein BKP49_04350 [Treponema sp. CETP13]|nr:MAG: hypothetical protein BKP49_04350 [Treponema sp. CETP13]
MKKKVLIIIVSILALEWGAVAQETELERLWQTTMQNNGDVLSAQHTYESACLSRRTLDATYAPSVSTSTSSSFPDEYEWDECPASVSSSVSLSQPLPGGTTLGLTGTYALSTADVNSVQYISQVPTISITLSQSLAPFWSQGTLKDPTKLSLEQQKQYYYYQLLYTKQQTLQTVTQYYVLCLIYKKKIDVYNASIAYKQKQIEALTELKKTGGTNLAKIAELKTSQWSDEQSMSDVQITYQEYCKYLKDACGIDAFQIKKAHLPSNETKIALAYINNVSDPCGKALLLKIDMLTTTSQLTKQNSAPLLGLSFTPSWGLETLETTDWKSAWDKDKTYSWTASVSLNFTPFISSLYSHTKDTENIQLQTAQDAYSYYVKQKRYVKDKYQTLLESFRQQQTQAEQLCSELAQLATDSKQQLDLGALSQLDYDSIQLQVQSCNATLDYINLYMWLYNWQIEMLE